jgi:hypothetical protein
MQKNTPVQDQAIKYQVLRLNRSPKAPLRSVTKSPRRLKQGAAEKISSKIQQQKMKN